MSALEQTDASKSCMKALQTALADVKPPFCSGILPVNQSNLVLFYGNTKGQSARIDFANASDTELERLAEACEPATFGLNKEDVLDESYRKAGKMDTRHFATKLDVHSTGLTDVVRFGLLEGKKATRAFRTELYKLNIYDKGAFFKAHKDTPRGEKMFGSLVIVFPTLHEGGSLLLRHEGKEWAVDSGQLVAEKRNSNPEKAHVVFATFFSDVEHEVTPVKSGYRVTLTYNLYFDPSSNPTVDRPLQVTEKTMPPESNAFKTALSDLIQEPTFLPEGGGIGFGLYHQYPVSQSSDDIAGVREYLKGRDAMIMQACDELSLDANLWLLYDDNRYDTRFLAENMLDVDDMVEEPLLYYALNRRSWMRVRIVERYGNNKYATESYDRRIGKPVEKIVWAREASSLNKIAKQYVAHGNEAEWEWEYAKVCLVVDIGPPGNR